MKHTKQSDTLQVLQDTDAKKIARKAVYDVYKWITKGKRGIIGSFLPGSSGELEKLIHRSGMQNEMFCYENRRSVFMMNLDGGNSSGRYEGELVLPFTFPVNKGDTHHGISESGNSILNYVYGDFEFPSLDYVTSDIVPFVWADYCGVFTHSIMGKMSNFINDCGNEDASFIAVTFCLNDRNSYDGIKEVYAGDDSNIKAQAIIDYIAKGFKGKYKKVIDFRYIGGKCTPMLTVGWVLNVKADNCPKYLHKSTKEVPVLKVRKQLSSEELRKRIAKMIAEGKDNAEIGRILNISAGSVASRNSWNHPNLSKKLAKNSCNS